MTPSITLHVGDALAVLRSLPDASADSLVTDPPAGISFMGRAWDSNKGGAEPWIAWLSEILAEALRVLKPGAHGLVWSLPRTSHWTGAAIERAGFEIRDCVTHLFGQGMPKGQNVSKAIDKIHGAKREIIGKNPCARPNSDGSYDSVFGTAGHDPHLTAPGSPEAAEWEGWNTALKPSAELWWLVRKPLAEKTIARNVLVHRTGAINVDACRIPTGGESLGTYTGKSWGAEGRDKGWSRPWMDDPEKLAAAVERINANVRKSEKLGRWPANLVLSHAPGCVCLGEKRVDVPRGKHAKAYGEKASSIYGNDQTDKGTGTAGFVDDDGKETVADWRCVEGCPVAALDEQTAERPQGRFPTNAVLSHLPGCECVGTKQIKGANPIGTRGRVYSDRVWCEGGGWKGRKPSSHVDDDGKESVADWQCVEGCPVAALDEQSGELKSGGGDKGSRAPGRQGYGSNAKAYSSPGWKPDKGGASRFFYQAKAAPSEKIGYCRVCDTFVPTRQRKDHGKKATGHDDSSFVAHPTQKSLALMQWLTRLVTPPGGLVLDPFCGVGTTGVAALLEGFGFVGCDLERDFVRIAMHRIRKAWEGDQ